MNRSTTDLVTILGPTASGKTALAARLAYDVCGEVISADSRQVYRRMDIGTGKDLADYTVEGTLVPFHLIDIAEPGYEYNIFEFQRDFLATFTDITLRGKVPVLCGGSGMYLETVLKGYQLHEAAGNEDLQASLEGKTMDELEAILRSFKTLHNVTDLADRPRLLKAILIALQDRETARAGRTGPGDITLSRVRQPEIFGIRFPRETEMQRIAERLEFRLHNGMIEEVEALLNTGVPPERLIRYGLEYRYVTLYLEGRITHTDLFLQLNIAIRQFAKRQMTWFRRMERQGMEIHWIDGRLPLDNMVTIIRKQAGI